jgi:hypothetical protein
MLTGKAKELFDVFYLKQLREQRSDYNKFSDEQLLRKFERKPLNEKWGVIEDFAESIGYVMNAYKKLENDLENGFGYEFEICLKWGGILRQSMFDSRQEAREEAIKELCRLANK